LSERYPALSNPTVPEFLLSETKGLVNSVESDLRTVDTKAMGQVGFSGTVVAIMAGVHASIPAWAQGLAGVLLFFSIILSVWSIFIRGVNYPTLDEYMDLDIAEEASNKARIALELAKSWQGYIADISKLLSSKALTFRLSALSFGAAVVVVIVAVLAQIAASALGR